MVKWEEENDNDDSNDDNNENDNGNDVKNNQQRKFMPNIYFYTIFRPKIRTVDCTWVSERVRESFGTEHWIIFCFVCK